MKRRKRKLAERRAWSLLLFASAALFSLLAVQCGLIFGHEPETRQPDASGINQSDDRMQIVPASNELERLLIGAESSVKLLKIGRQSNKLAPYDKALNQTPSANFLASNLTALRQFVGAPAAPSYIQNGHQPLPTVLLWPPASHVVWLPSHQIAPINATNFLFELSQLNKQHQRPISLQESTPTSTNSSENRFESRLKIESPNNEEDLLESKLKQASSREQNNSTKPYSKSMAPLDSRMLTNQSLVSLSCESNQMKVRLKFKEPFEGQVSARLGHISPNCKLIGTGQLEYEMVIGLRDCGTQHSGQHATNEFTNSLQIQFHPSAAASSQLGLVEDELKTLVCSYPLKLRAPKPIANQSFPVQTNSKRFEKIVDKSEKPQAAAKLIYYEPLLALAGLLLGTLTLLGFTAGAFLLSQQVRKQQQHPRINRKSPGQQSGGAGRVLVVPPLLSVSPNGLKAASSGRKLKSNRRILSKPTIPSERYIDFKPIASDDRKKIKVKQQRRDSLKDKTSSTSVTTIEIPYVASIQKLEERAGQQGEQTEVKRPPSLERRKSPLQPTVIRKMPDIRVKHYEDPKFGSIRKTLTSPEQFRRLERFASLFGELTNSSTDVQLRPILESIDELSRRKLAEKLRHDETFRSLVLDSINDKEKFERKLQNSPIYSSQFEPHVWSALGQILDLERKQDRAQSDSQRLTDSAKSRTASNDFIQKDLNTAKQISIPPIEVKSLKIDDAVQNESRGKHQDQPEISDQKESEKNFEKLKQPSSPAGPQVKETSMKLVNQVETTKLISTSSNHQQQQERKPSPKLPPKPPTDLVTRRLNVINNQLKPKIDQKNQSQIADLTPETQFVSGQQVKHEDHEARDVQREQDDDLLESWAESKSEAEADVEEKTSMDSLEQRRHDPSSSPLGNPKILEQLQNESPPSNPMKLEESEMKYRAAQAEAKEDLKEDLKSKPRDQAHWAPFELRSEADIRPTVRVSQFQSGKSIRRVGGLSGTLINIDSITDFSSSKQFYTYTRSRIQQSASLDVVRSFPSDSNQINIRNEESFDGSFLYADWEQAERASLALSSSDIEQSRPRPKNS